MNSFRNAKCHIIYVMVWDWDVVKWHLEDNEAMKCLIKELY